VEEAVYVAQCSEISTASQGETVDEALANLQEKTGLHLEKVMIDWS
jgi:predicted RNase H-like HicB family nuclease